MTYLFFAVAFNRVAVQALDLSDGRRIPKGTHFVVPSAAVLMDPDILPNPEKFDGFRFSRPRTVAEESNHHQYTTTTNSQLHFGHGKYSCPGRFFASLEIKMMLCHILSNYDLKYPTGATRPVNMRADDNIFPNPEAKLMMSRRQ